MATWNASNLKLTNQGLEVLSKVQSGIGALTVSRIVAGSGRVDASLLAQQTAVSSEKLEATLTSVNTDEDGSILNISLANTGLAQAFTMNQIGVYVTHQDYPSEVLYFIGQCDADTGDEIPLPTTTPTELFFSIYLAHIGVDQLSIEVATTGASQRSIVQDDVIPTAWVGSGVPYTQEHSFSGATAVSVIEIVLPDTATAQQVQQFQELNLQGGVQATGTFQIRAFGDLNTVEIPIKVIKRGDV